MLSCRLPEWQCVWVGIPCGTAPAQCRVRQLRPQSEPVPLPCLSPLCPLPLQGGDKGPGYSSPCGVWLDPRNTHWARGWLQPILHPDPGSVLVLSCAARSPKCDGAWAEAEELPRQPSAARKCPAWGCRGWHRSAWSPLLQHSPWPVCAQSFQPFLVRPLHRPRDLPSLHAHPSSSWFYLLWPLWVSQTCRPRQCVPAEPSPRF